MARTAIFYPFLASDGFLKKIQIFDVRANSREKLQGIVSAFTETCFNADPRMEHVYFDNSGVAGVAG
jgi:hypothetical protein